MRKILILSAVALLGAAAAEVAGGASGQEPDCGSFQASISGADTREVHGGMATISTVADGPVTLLDLRAAVPGADSVLVLSFSRHSAMPPAGDYGISSRAASGESFSGSYLRVRRDGGIATFDGDSGTMILSAAENGKVRGDFEFTGRTGEAPAEEVRVRGTFTALVGRQAGRCRRAAGRVAVPAGMPGAPLLAGRGPLRRTPAADSASRRPPAPGETPFGLRMGMTLSDLARYGVTPEDVDRGIYRLARVPRPLEGFRDVRVAVSPSEGLCRLTASSPPITSGDDGAAVKAAFDRAEASLRTMYGHSDRMEFQTDEGRLHERPWMTELQRNEQRLVSYWVSVAGSTLPLDLTGIELEARATSATSGSLAVHYQFRNFGTCRGEPR
jgi:hypothetical protein